MYLPSHFQESRVAELHALMRKHPLGALVTRGVSGLEANHVPFAVDGPPGPNGKLRCHVARANGVWRDLSHEREVLVIFQGPDAYVSPSVYEDKPKHGKVVPTWNYAVVHAYGTAQVVHDRAWLRQLLADLTNAQEASRAEPWALEDAPPDFVDKMVEAIVGIEVQITRLTGKWKMSQNRSATDRRRVANDLSERPGDHGAVVALLHTLES